MRTIALLCACTALATQTIAATPGDAPWGVSVANGSGAKGQEHRAHRIGLQRHWQRNWWQHRYFRFTGYWDLSLALFDASDLSGGPADDGSSRIWAIAGAPVLRWQFAQLGQLPVAPFLEVGVGVTLLSDRRLRSGKIRSYPLGSYFQFEDRAVFGFRIGRRWELAYQRMHYSNLELASSNNGIDAHLALLRYRFDAK